MPLAEPHIAQPVYPAAKAAGKEDPMQILWRPRMQYRVVEHFSGGALAIFALAMGPMRLLVVCLHPALMLELGAFPARHLGKVKISQTALQVEIRLDKIFPRLLLVNLLLLDAQLGVDKLRLFRDKNAPLSLTNRSGEPCLRMASLKMRRYASSSWRWHTLL